METPNVCPGEVATWMVGPRAALSAVKRVRRRHLRQPPVLSSDFSLVFTVFCLFPTGSLTLDSIMTASVQRGSTNQYRPHASLTFTARLLWHDPTLLCHLLETARIHAVKQADQTSGRGVNPCFIASYYSVFP